MPEGSQQYIKYLCVFIIVTTSHFFFLSTFRYSFIGLAIINFNRKCNADTRVSFFIFPVVSNELRNTMTIMLNSRYIIIVNNVSK